MAIGGEEEPERVTPESWLALARACGLNGRLLLRDLQALAVKVAAAADAVAVTARAEGWHQAVIDDVRAVVARRAELLHA